MGLDAIESGTLRVLDTARLPDNNERAAAVTARAPAPPAAKDALRGEPAVRGVPKRLGVQQQLPPNTRLRVDEETKQIVVQILDENNEVIRQIPAEALLELSSRFNRLEGLLFNRES